MRTSLQILDSVYVDDPCPVAWDSMSGSHRVRFCSQCKQSVFDVSSLSAHDAAQLIQESGGNLCVRFYRRLDGTLVTKECAPIRALRFARRTVARAGLALASLFGFAFAVSGCSKESDLPRSTMGAITMGKIACPAPETDEPAQAQKPKAEKTDRAGN